MQQNDLDYAEAVLAAGGNVDVVNLPKARIRGNSHMVVMDKNSDEVANVIQSWLAKKASRAELAGFSVLIFDAAQQETIHRQKTWQRAARGLRGRAVRASGL